MKRPLGFGMMRLPLTDPENKARINVDATKQMVDTFLEAGFTYFDTAFPYHDGRSETVLREVLTDRCPRESFEVATKLPIFNLTTEEEMKRVFEEQFRRCGVEYFDRYLVHNVNGDTLRAADHIGVWDFVAVQKKAGRLKSVGFSFHDDADLLEKFLCDHPEMEFVQLQINYLDWDDAAVQSRRCYETARAHGLPVIVMEPVRGGTLADLPEEFASQIGSSSDQAALALRYAAELDGVVMTLSGMSTPQQLADNVRLFNHMEPLTDGEKAMLPEIVKALRAGIRVPCTACDYCSGCPQNIPIPRYFSLFNDYKVNDSGFSSQQMYYENAVAQGFGRADDCIACHQCEQECPQHIHIVEKMADVSKTFDKEGA